MTTTELEEIVNSLYDINLDELAIDDMDTLAAEVKQYGLDLPITQELIDAYHGDYLDKYCESKI